jgi:ribosomal protein S18 acetylase RimI-like enzyme
MIISVPSLQNICIVICNMSLTVRYATKEDALLIAEISHQTFYQTFAAHNTKADMEKFLREQFTRGKLMMEVGTPENIFLLAYDGKEVAGYAKLRDSRIPNGIGSPKALELARLYAMHNMIGKGVGSFLMQSCIDIAKQKEKDYLWLGVWEKNIRAINFYAKWGFEKFGETDFLLGDDVQRDWLMKRSCEL